MASAKIETGGQPTGTHSGTNDSSTEPRSPWTQLSISTEPPSPLGHLLRCAPGGRFVRAQCSHSSPSARSSFLEFILKWKRKGLLLHHAIEMASIPGAIASKKKKHRSYCFTKSLKTPKRLNSQHHPIRTLLLAHRSSAFPSNPGGSDAQRGPSTNKLALRVLGGGVRCVPAPC